MENKTVVISTKFGKIKIKLYDDTPKHKANFIKLATEGFFNGTTFHRVIPNFMIQGGDPNSKNKDKSTHGMGGPGYTIPAEILPNHKHKRGSLAAARMGDNVNPKKESSGSQFYICVVETSFLDNAYTVFGEVTEGMDVADKIVAQPKDGRDNPDERIEMTVTFE
ncbi:peptidylprolyl isomerase [bacterium]|nr:peptidylprolyl isomerase [bacterium]